LSGIATAITAVATVARSTAYTTAMLRKPPTPNGFWYRCSTAGTSAATAPTYGTTDGGTTTDGTSVWTAFKAPDVQTLGTTNHYYMPAIRVAINGTLTNTNPQQENFLCYDLFIYTGNFTSGAWASDGTTPLWDGVHFATTRTSTSGADPSAFFLQAGAQCTFIGGEVQVSGGVSFEAGTTPRTYKTRWRNTKEWGASSSRFRSYTTSAIFQDVEVYDMAFDLFRMPTVAPSIKARGSEYVYQYVGAGAGGADAKFSASSLENLNGTYDFDNYFGGWVELYNCAKGASLNVVSQYPNSSIWVKHLVPLYQDLRITAKDASGNLLQNVRFNTTDAPTNSPTVTFTTAGGLKTWDFRNPFSYETTTNASGIALSTPVLQAWYWQTSFKQNLRFPLSTATYQGRAYNYKTMNVSVVLGSNSIQDVSAGMNALDTATTVTESVAEAITGITLTPSGATGGTITISSNKEYQDIWNYYRYWISQFANKASNDTWTCTGGTLNTQNWNIVVNTGVTITSSTNISTLKTLGTVTLNGTAKIEALYESALGQSTTWTFSSVESGSSIVIYNASGATKYFQAVTTAGDYSYYIAPQTTGEAYTFAVEKYGFKREQGSFMSNAGGSIGYVPDYAEDIGIDVTNQTTVNGYTTLTTLNQIYDAIANYRLSEAGIKKGQIVTRDGLYLDFGIYSVLVKDTATSVVDVTSSLVTLKGLVIDATSKYSSAKATPPATITANDTEQLNFVIEDANGDSQLSISGGDNLGYKLYKVPSSAPVDVDPTTGTLLATLATNEEIYRFIGISGFDIIGVDLSSGVKRRSSMLKGVYTQSFYVGSQIQLDSQALPLLSLIDKIEALQLKVDTDLDVAVSTRLADADYIDPATPQTVWEYTTRTLTSAGSSGATLAEIEGSLILAMKADVQAVETKVDTKPTLAEMEAETTNLAKEDRLVVMQNTMDSFAGNDFDGMTDSLDAISTKVDGIDTNLEVINRNVQDASLLIPASEELT
jgi:hypothetical protein